MVLKLYCVFSKEAIKEMKGNRGKLAAQAGHAFLHTIWNSEYRFPDKLRKYRSTEHEATPQKAYKIVLVVDTTAELLELLKEHELYCGTALVTDAGLTVFNEPTTTCLGIGPVDPKDVSEKLKGLKVLI